MKHHIPLFSIERGSCKFFAQAWNHDPPHLRSQPPPKGLGLQEWGTLLNKVLKIHYSRMVQGQSDIITKWKLCTSQPPQSSQLWSENYLHNWQCFFAHCCVI
jgi:hypothetical protein